MFDMKKLKIGVIFGSRSVEHEVSIITALQVMYAIDKSKYEVVPIYISKEGNWFSGKKLFEQENFKDISSLVSKLEKVYISPDSSVSALFKTSQKLFKSNSIKIDAVFPLVHGTYGEDGTLQGLLELANIPYVGAAVLGSALGMDKIAMKAVFRENQLPIVNYIWFLRREWENSSDDIIAKIEANLKYPMFVKPSNLGSSIGISRVKDRKELRYGIDIASHYDRRLLVEEALEDAMEINCSVLGNDNPISSVCEQPVSWQEFLKYEDKYLKGNKTNGLKAAARHIPAPISPELTKEIQGLAIKAFKSIDCYGIARVDFLINHKKQKVFVNEINTIPGSISFYLWEATNIKFSDLIDKLIKLAFEAHKEKGKTLYSYDSKLLGQVGIKR